MNPVDNRLRHVVVTTYADGRSNLRGIPIVKRKNHVASVLEITGRAPKQEVLVYEFRKAVSVRENLWSRYIAKTGERYYPIESITEHLFTRIGQTLHLNMAETKLSIIRGQLRLLSKVFVPSRRFQLIHGAEILTAHLDGDKEFVQEIVRGQKKLASSIVFVDDIIEAIQNMFPNHYNPLVEGLLQTLLFDAWSGCLDRHLYNWGVIRDVTDRLPPAFAPIYDSARGLYWRHTDRDLRDHLGDRGKAKRSKYIDDSCPELGAKGQVRKCNHFDIARRIIALCDSPSHTWASQTKNWLCTTFTDDARNLVCRMIENEFGIMLSPVRIKAIQQTIIDRHEKFSQILKEFK